MWEIRGLSLLGLNGLIESLISKVRIFKLIIGSCQLLMGFHCLCKKQQSKEKAQQFNVLTYTENQIQGLILSIRDADGTKRLPCEKIHFADHLGHFSCPKHNLIICIFKVTQLKLRSHQVHICDELPKLLLLLCLFKKNHTLFSLFIFLCFKEVGCEGYLPSPPPL